MTELTVQEYLINELHQELLQMPMWTYAAFDSLQDSDSLQSSDPRSQLIRYLVNNHIQKMPKNRESRDYLYSWKAEDFVPVIKHVVKTIRPKQTSQ